MSFGLAIPKGQGSPSEALWPCWAPSSPFSRACKLAAGRCWPWCPRGGATSRGRSMTLAGAGGLILLGASLRLITDTTPCPDLWTLLPMGAAVLLLIAGSHAGNPESRAQATRPIVRIGDWSHLIYQWPWPFIALVGLP